MKAFAVFTIHEQADVEWVEKKCAYVKGIDGVLRGGVVLPDGAVAVWRSTHGGAIGHIAQVAAADVGGVCIEFNNEASTFPTQTEAYAALAAQRGGAA